MPNFKEFIKGFEEKPAPQKSQRDLDTEEHNKIVAQINAKAPKMKHEDYKAEIAKEDARFNSVQDKWEDEPKPQPKENRDQIIEKVNQKMMNANTYGALGDKENYEKSIAEAEELRKGLAPKAEPKQEPNTKYKGGFAKDLQDAGFDPYEVDEEKQILRVKDARGADYEISQGRGYSYNVFKDGKKIYENVPDYMRFDTVVAGKPEAGFERFQVQDDSDISAPAAQPKQGNFQEAFGGTSEIEDEKATQPDGYYKDDNGEIYMMKGGKDYYPVGEAERQDFFRAFNNQNKEKAKEMANAPETAKSFERIYADLDKGFEETYKRKPTQEEKDALRDIARLQTALIVMATKK